MPEKTEPPTPKRIRDARDKGQFLFSKEVVSLCTLVAVSTSFLFLKDFIYLKVQHLLFFAIAMSDNQDFFQVAQELLLATVAAIGFAALGSYSVGIAISIFANVFQVGLVFSFAKLTKGLQSLNFINNAQQMFSKKNLFNFLLNIIKVIVIGLTVAWVVNNQLRDTLLSPECGLGCVLDVGLTSFITMIAIVSGIFLPLAVIDYLIQRWLYLAELKMSLEEIKQEFKESEGNPEIKSQRKQLHRELVMSDTKEKVAQSSIVVTNPTHCAVALRYVEEETPIPLVMAKGEGTIAQEIIKAAERANIPVYQDVSLAWELYGDAEIDHYIPENLLRPVALMLRTIKSQAVLGL